MDPVQFVGEGGEKSTWTVLPCEVSQEWTAFQNMASMIARIIVVPSGFSK